MILCPIVLERLKWDEESQEVVYTAHPRKAAGSYGSEARWDVLNFIARITQHIPDVGQQYQRYWGFYSNAARGKRRRDEVTDDSEKSGDSATNHDDIRRVPPRTADRRAAASPLSATRSGP